VIDGTPLIARTAHPPSERFDVNKKRVLGGVAALMSGAGIAQISGLLTMPILSRIYSPEAFTIFLLYTSIVAILNGMSCLRYEVAIVNEPDDNLVVDVMLLCAVVSSSLACVAILFLGLSKFTGLQIPASLKQIVWFLPLTVLFCGLQLLLTGWQLRHQRYTSLAKATAGRGILTGLASIGLAGAGGVGLVVGELVGRLSGVIILLCRMPSIATHAARQDIWTRVKSTALRYRQLPLFSLPSIMINTVGGVLAPLAMIAAFDTTVSGQFALIERCIAVPFGLLIQSSTQVYMTTLGALLRANTIQTSKSAIKLMHKFMLMHFALAVIPCFILFFWAKPLFAIIFGPNWQLAAEMAQLMTPMFLVGTVVGSIQATLITLGRHDLQFAWDCLRFALIVGVWLLVFGLRLTPVQAVGLYATTGCLIQLIFGIMARHQLGRNSNRIIVDTAKI
jgi:O-antigen/teichoic acid export membrane protein